MFSVLFDILAFHEVSSVQEYERKKEKEYKVLHRTRD